MQEIDKSTGLHFTKAKAREYDHSFWNQQSGKL